MTRSKILFTAAAFAVGIAFGGTAQAATFAPMKAQADVAKAMSPVAQIRHRWRNRMWMYGDGYGYGGRHHGHRYAFYGRRHRFRPFLYDPFSYGYSYGYDPYSYGYSGGYGDSYGYGNCYRPGVSFYWGY
jgi:hypothetical protein